MKTKLTKKRSLSVTTADTKDKEVAEAATQSALLADFQDHECFDPLQYCTYAPFEQYITKIVTINTS